jgi:DNA polymerase III subunit epsilon
MTGGQGALALTEADGPTRAAEGARPARVLVRAGLELIVLRASDEEARAHESMLALIARASGGRCLWPLVDPAQLGVGAQRSSA